MCNCLSQNHYYIKKTITFASDILYPKHSLRSRPSCEIVTAFFYLIGKKDDFKQKKPHGT